MKGYSRLALSLFLRRIAKNRRHFLSRTLISSCWTTVPWLAGYTKFYAMSIAMSYLASSTSIAYSPYDVFGNAADLNKRFNKYTVIPVSKRADGDNVKDDLRAFACCDNTYYKVRLPNNVTDAQVPKMLNMPSMGVYDRAGG